MDAVEDIKQRLSIEDVLAEYVELKRAGRNFKALSPFSNEKTPSLMISPEKQIWHDFSSGKGGDMFSFVMEVEGYDFKTTLELLARKAGLDLSQYRRSGGQDNSKFKARLSEAHELATKFYQMHMSKSQEAIDYVFKKRGIDKRTALSFKLGYAPNNGGALTDFLRKRGFTSEELEKAGLSTKRARGLSDMFRGRIMIPLMDQGGVVIGFTGRLLEDIPNAPKYLNTPQTLLYDKGRHEFGLHLAKDTIRRSKYAVVVEGNMDVIASHQANVTNVVATAGTAMTEMHLKALGRFVHDVRLSFDQDNAGLAAAERAIPLAAKVGVSLSMITITGAKDPDELIQKDPAAWAAAIEQPQYAVDWLMEQYTHKLDITTAPGKREFSDVTLRVIRGLTDSVEQEHYLEKLGTVLGVSKGALERKLAGQPVAKPTKRRIDPPKVDPHSAELIRSQNHLLCLALAVPNLRDYLVPLAEDMIMEPPARKLLAFLRANPDYDGTTAPGALKEVGDYGKMLALLFEETYQSLETLELRDEAARLQARLIEQYVKHKKAALATALRDANDTDTDHLLKQVAELDTMLRRIKAER